MVLLVSYAKFIHAVFIRLFLVLQILVTNTAETRKYISKYFIETEPSNLTLISPKKGGTFIEPKDSVTFSFAYNRAFCSFFSEVFIIESGGFQIGRLIQWEVVNKTLLPTPESPPAMVDENYYRKSRHEMAQSELYLHENKYAQQVTFFYLIW